MTDIKVEMNWDHLPHMSPLKWDGDCEFSGKYQRAMKEIGARDREINELRDTVERHRRLIAALVAEAGGMVLLTYLRCDDAAHDPIDIFGYKADAVIVRTGEQNDPIDYAILDALEAAHGELES